MNWISLRLKNLFFIFLSTTFLILIIELLMYGLHLTTGSKYFANAGDFSITITNDCPDSFNLEGTQIRVAIFGGSSSAGYASPISFSKILCDYSSKDKNLVITNIKF